MPIIPVHPADVTHLCLAQGHREYNVEGSSLRSWNTGQFLHEMRQWICHCWLICRWRYMTPLFWGFPSSTRLGRNKESFPLLNKSKPCLASANYHWHGPIWPRKGAVVATEKPDSVQLEQKPTRSWVQPLSGFSLWFFLSISLVHIHLSQNCWGRMIFSIH